MWHSLTNSLRVTDLLPCLWRRATACAVVDTLLAAAPVAGSLALASTRLPSLETGGFVPYTNLAAADPLGAAVGGTALALMGLLEVAMR